MLVAVTGGGRILCSQTTSEALHSRPCPELRGQLCPLGRAATCEAAFNPTDLCQVPPENKALCVQHVPRGVSSASRKMGEPDDNPREGQGSRGRRAGHSGQGLPISWPGQETEAHRPIGSRGVTAGAGAALVFRVASGQGQLRLSRRPERPAARPVSEPGAQAFAVTSAGAQVQSRGACARRVSRSRGVLGGLCRPRPVVGQR